MNTFNFTIDNNGSTNRLIVRLDALPDAIKRKLKPAISALTAELLLRVIAAEPQRTGRLRALTRSFVDEGDNWVRGRVRVLRTRNQNTAAAAGALEYGAHRVFPVRAHRATLTKVFGHRVTPRSISVGAYQRRANIEALRFLRGPAAALRPQARALLEAAIVEALQKET